MTSDIKEVSVSAHSTATPSTSTWQVCNVSPPSCNLSAAYREPVSCAAPPSCLCVQNSYDTVSQPSAGLMACLKFWVIGQKCKLFVLSEGKFTVRGQVRWDLPQTLKQLIKIWGKSFIYFCIFVFFYFCLFGVHTLSLYFSRWNCQTVSELLIIQYIFMNHHKLCSF